MQPMQSLFIDIKGLVGAYENCPKFLSGKQMKELVVLENAWLSVDNGLVKGFGTMNSCPELENVNVVDCSGRYVIPSWCDSHTHLVYAIDRAGEFLDRLRGLTYAEIAAKGGGILNSAKALRSMSVAQIRS